MTPELELQLTFAFDRAGRIRSTREPWPSRGPRFSLIRSFTQCAWAIRDDIPPEPALELAQLAGTEPPLSELRSSPLHAQSYLALAGGQPGFHGPAFTFPERLPALQEVELVADQRCLEAHFKGWQPGELAAGRAPLLAILERGQAVSICFCARRSERAAAAGVETAAAFRGRGLAPRVVAAWAQAVRAAGSTPSYSAAWSNVASLRVAQKLGLTPHATFWNIA